MGKWFPDLRKGSKEQVREFDKAQAEQLRNAEQERKAGVREATPRYEELNRRTNETMRPLSPLQRSMSAHDMREAGRKFRERREQRKPQRGRGSR